MGRPGSSCFNPHVRNPKVIPIALTIAGSDSGGGAGVQADLKTFAAVGAHGTSAITCLTAQNPRRVLAIEACSARMVRRQIAAVIAELPPRAVKTGMLFSAEIILEVVRASKSLRCPLVVDPVMVATSGAALLKPDAVRALMQDLFPVATLITPNVPEAEALLGNRICEVADLRAAARELRRRFKCAALVKGGHLTNTRDAVDIFFDGKTELLLSSPRVQGINTHGTGCTFSAAIAGYLAHGEKLERAVVLAKDFVSNAIANAQRAGRHDVLSYS